MKKVSTFLIDEKDCLILNLLQENCRMSLTEISKKIGLSVDSVKKRINKMLSKRIFYPKIQLRPRQFGFPNIVDVKIKLQDYDNKKIKEFIRYIETHPRIAEAFSISGEWDFTLVIISKNNEDLALLTDEIRQKFGSIIRDWSGSLTTFTYRFERYDMLKLIGYKTKVALKS